MDERGNTACQKHIFPNNQTPSLKSKIRKQLSGIEKMKSGYIQVKIKFCQAFPFCGLGALGMWYSTAVESEIHKWNADSRSATLGKATDKVALCFRKDGYSLRKIKTDGSLLCVYDWESQQLLPDSLLPIKVLGDNIEIMEIADVPSKLKAKGGYYCKFTVKGLTYTGYVLSGKHYSAAWTDRQRALHFEEQGAKNPNAQIIQKLPEP
ncbi:MAG TPA: hypothetical protein VIK62_01125 [Verrucomicrobiae bacterium]